MGPSCNHFPSMSKPIGEMNELDCLRWLVAGLTGGPSGSGGGGNSSVASIRPATFNASAAGTPSSSSNNTSVQVGPSVTVARKIDIVNTGANGIWVNRAGAAAVGSLYYLAQYGVLSVDEPTTDAFYFISPSGAQTCSYINRVAV